VQFKFDHVSAYFMSWIVRDYLLDKIAVLLRVYKLHDLAIGDYSSDSSPILVFVY